MRRTAAPRNTGNQPQQRESSNPFELLQVRHTLTEAQAHRTQQRVNYYEEIAQRTRLAEQQQSSSSGPQDIEAENPDFTQLEWTNDGYCADTRPYQIFPWCTYHKISWQLVTSDTTGLIWTRTIPSGQQEWLTGSILENGDWQFNQTREVNEIYPS